MTALIGLILCLATLLCSTHSENDYNWLFTTQKIIEYHPVASVNTESTTTPIPVNTGCGWRQDSGSVDRITQSNNAMFGEFPWVVAIFKYSAENGTYDYCCVGSLIHHRVVLTVKHYFRTPARIRIHAGDWDISSTNYEIYYHQSSDVKSIMGHPKYNPTTNAYDAALLLLSTSINLAPNVAFACLPPPASSTPAGVRCIVAGWGQETYYNGSIRNILKMVDPPVVEHSVCETQLNAVLKMHIDLPDSMMCAGGEAGIDACLKDGGAPLVCPYQDTKGRYYQAGIVSWGVGCGRQNVPGVYTSLPAIRDWIDSTMTGLKYDITYVPQVNKLVEY